MALPLVSGVIKLAAGESEAASKLIGKEVSSEEKAAAKEVKADGGFGIADPNSDAAPHQVSTDSNSGGGENVPSENVNSSGDNGAVCANSFSANTPVETNNNGSTKTISNVQLGDQVLAYNQDTGATATYTVTNVLVHLDPVLVDLTVDGETVETTPEHPFYIEQYGWLDAGLLWQGAQIRRADGSDGTVQAVKVVHKQQVMYNLTVDTAHTFFVGNKHFLVHNVGPNPPCNGITLRNHEFAGKTYTFDTSNPRYADATGQDLRELQALEKKYPNGVPFDKDGFPDFSQYVKMDVTIKMAGSTKDFITANKAAKAIDPGFKKSNYSDYTWHHHQDRQTMQLVPSDLHEAVRHTGGVYFTKILGQLP